MARDGAQWFTAESFVLHQGGAVWDQAAELQKVNVNLCSFVTHNSDISPNSIGSTRYLKYNNGLVHLFLNPKEVGVSKARGC